MRHASPLTEQRRVCSSVGLAAWCGLVAPESRLKEAATWCQVAARITVTAATTGQLDTCTANTRQSGQCNVNKLHTPIFNGYSILNFLYDIVAIIENNAVCAQI